MYTDFANVYDLLMQDVDYTAWARHYLDLLGPGILRVTECACGTGSITIPLREAGLSMTGADLSGEMLQRAMEKSRARGLQIPYIRQDMRFLQVMRPQDAVLATCDGVNYLLSKEDALRFFTSAWKGLKPGGKLLFDFSSSYKLRNVLGSNILTLDEDDCAYIWLNTWHEKTRTVKMELSIFTRENETERFIRTREEQTQRAWTCDELRSLLLQAGFENIAFFGGMRMDAPADKDERIFTVCEKGA